MAKKHVKHLIVFLCLILFIGLLSWFLSPPATKTPKTPTVAQELTNQTPLQEQIIEQRPLVDDKVPEKVVCGSVVFEWDNAKIVIAKQNGENILSRSVLTSNHDRIQAVECDSVAFQKQNLLRIDYYSGGAHCCFESYWFDAVANRVYGIDFVYGPPGNRPTLNKQGLIQAYDWSLAYFDSSEVSLGFAESPTLPAAYCFKENGFEDCSKEYADYQNELKQVRSEIAAHDKEEIPNALLVKYVALVKKTGRQDLYQELLKADFRDGKIEGISTGLDVAFQPTDYSYTKTYGINDNRVGFYE